MGKALPLRTDTQLTDFDMSRVLPAGIPGRVRSERWPATFDSNGSPRQSRRPLGPAAAYDLIAIKILDFIAMSEIKEIHVPLEFIRQQLRNCGRSIFVSNTSRRLTKRQIFDALLIETRQKNIVD